MSLLLRLAIPAPLRRAFDYLPPTGTVSAKTLTPGLRVRVPFGRQSMVGVLLEVVEASQSGVPSSKLKRAEAILDTTPLLPDEIMQLLLWCGQYYHHPLGEILHNALPVKLRQGETAQVRGIQRWSLNATGQMLTIDEFKRAPRQAALFHALQQRPQGLTASELDLIQENWRTTMKRLEEKNCIAVSEESALPLACNRGDSPPLNPEQQQAVDRISQTPEQFHAWLLDGVTGSGKTEVYLEIIRRTLAMGKQALVLVPEIGLTPQLLQRFMTRLDARIALLHSGLNDEERLQAWLAARSGEASVIIGTRSAVFTPMPNPGVIIIDEEHDLSFKQQEGFRYSARDLAVIRARNLGMPIILGSATPSLETLHNVRQQRYSALQLPQRAGSATTPVIRLLDVRSQKMEHGISAQLLAAMQQHLQQGNQVLLFINRRGYAPLLMCHACGWHARCARCDAHMTLHQGINKLRCHHCGSERAAPEVCPQCEGEETLLSMGYGTERIETTLNEHFPSFPVLRIDRDTTRRKGSLHALLDKIHDGQPRILIGTQMLAKGHHFPDVTLVGILNADQGFYSADFRGSERMGQLILQVAGRAGRAEKSGEVLIQTHHPDHPLFLPLLQHDYHRFANILLQEREQTEWPPYSYLALLRAEAVDAGAPMQFLHEAKRCLPEHPHIMAMGPLPASMERRAGRFRAQLLLQSTQRGSLQQQLAQWLLRLEQLKSARKVRWSLDIDPQETF